MRFVVCALKCVAPVQDGKCKVAKADHIVIEVASDVAKAVTFSSFRYQPGTDESAPHLTCIAVCHDIKAKGGIICDHYDAEGVRVDGREICSQDLLLRRTAAILKWARSRWYHTPDRRP